MAHRAKRWLYLTHRWLGIGTCLLMAMWFLSGMVMMYVPFPSLSDAERLEGLSPIDWTIVKRMPVGPLTAHSLVLEQQLGKPVWRQEHTDGTNRTISAVSGHSLAGVGQEQAFQIAGAFARAPAVAIDSIDRDQWTVAGGFDRYRPLWKVEMLGPEGHFFYVASSDGRVVLDTSRRERFWNWLGSVPHWLYPTVLRQDQPLWRQVVMWTSGICIIGAVAGMWIGILRVRLRRRYKGGRTTPYRGWQFWHHVLGLIGGTVLSTWIVSGWLSVDPGRLFDSPGLSEDSLAAYLQPAPLPAVDWSRVALLPEAKDAKRVRVVWVDGQPRLVFERIGTAPSVLDLRSLVPTPFDQTRLVAAVQRVLPDHPIIGTDLLTHTDAYWYEAKGQVELPILRVRFGDSARTWIHVSPRTGEIVGSSDSRRRRYRWLYDGLHRWDFGFLIQHRPLWDLWMWAWLIPGLIISISGIVIGIRRLAR